jgi:hypothetical protein
VTDLQRGIPTTVELVRAVRLFLQDEVLPEAEGKLRFHARVSANVLASVERELEHGDGYREAHARRLATLGAADDAELADAIRDGRLDDRLADVVALLRESTRERVAITNPRYLAAEDEPPS